LYRPFGANRGMRLLRFFVQLAIGVAVLWSAIALVAAIDPGAAYRTQHFVLTLFARSI